MRAIRMTQQWRYGVRGRLRGSGGVPLDTITNAILAGRSTLGYTDRLSPIPKPRVGGESFLGHFLSALDMVTTFSTGSRVGRFSRRDNVGLEIGAALEDLPGYTRGNVALRSNPVSPGTHSANGRLALSHAAMARRAPTMNDVAAVAFLIDIPAR
jgi:hypothetical protein